MLGKTLVKIFLFSSIIILYSCSGKKAGDDSDFFLDNKNEIGIELADQELGVKFNPPKDWELTPSSLSRKIENKTNLSDGFVYQPVYLFFNRASLGVLSSGKVISNDTTLTGSAKLNYYKSFLAKKYKNANLSLANFVNAKIQFTQIKYEKENLVSYKLFFQNSRNEIVQFEYSVRKEILEQSLNAIKSSIGSIRSL
jgi:hypothetical protein